MKVVLLGAAAYTLACVFVAAGGPVHSAERVDGRSTRNSDTPCGVLNVSVRSPHPLDAKIACQGARDAIGFLAAQGFDVSGDVTIEVVQKLPDVAGDSAAGCYVESEQRVLVLTLSEFRKFKTWFGIPIDTALYRSLVSHEVAHIVAACNFRVARPSIQAKEYIAYVTTFATMTPERRNRVLSQFPGEGFEGDWQMSLTIYLIDPMRFGAEAYRHFLKPGNGRDYLHAILAGKVMVE